MQAVAPPIEDANYEHARQRRMGTLRQERHVLRQQVRAAVLLYTQAQLPSNRRRRAGVARRLMMRLERVESDIRDLERGPDFTVP